MRLLLINQFFWPDCAPTSQLLADVATDAALAGHEVTVLCSKSGYAPLNVDGEPPVRILRLAAAPFQRNPAGRILSYGSFLCGVLWHAMRVAKPDAVLLLTTPPLLGMVGTLLKRLRKCPYYIWEMDMYPDIAVDLGFLKQQSIGARSIGWAAERIWQGADGIIALGPCMKERLVRKGIAAEKIHVKENWANGTQIRPMPFPDNGRLNVLYSGNFGLAHDVTTILEGIKLLRQDRRFRFVFAGGGANRSALQKLCGEEDFPTVHFDPYCEPGGLSASLGACDVGLVTQLPQTAGSVVPSKVYGIMAAGRPVLYVGPKNATPCGVIERFGCGWQVDPGDTAALVRLLQRLADDSGAVAEAGANARLAFEQHYDRRIGAQRILDVIGGVTPTRPASPMPCQAAQEAVNGSSSNEEFA